VTCFFIPLQLIIRNFYADCFSLWHCSVNKPLTQIVIAVKFNFPPHEFIEEKALLGIRLAGEAYASSDWPQKLGRYHRDPDAVFRAWHDTWLSPEFRSWDITGCLSKITCPILAIQGEDDEYATMRQIECIAEAAPDVDLLKLADCRHSPHRDQPQAVIEAIVGFVDRLAVG